MTIKEVENKLNISRANIRYYEKEGLLLPKRNESDYRNYTNNDLKRLETILLFRKCNISIEDIRLIFNKTKSVEEVFKRQISIIDNEVKELIGAKEMCKVLSSENSSIENFDTNKYYNMMNNLENKGNKFYNIVEDYLLANEKLYQSIIENKKFKGSEKMKKNLKLGIYFISYIITFILFILFDLLITKKVDIPEVIIFTSIITVIDSLGTKKYIEHKTKEKYSKQDSIKYFLFTILMMIILLGSYYIIKSIYDVNKEPNENALQMSIKNDLLQIAKEEFESNDNLVYAESFKIIDYENTNNKIYVYINAKYGLLNNETCKLEESKESTLTIVYDKDKNATGTYDLVKYTKDIPNKLKEQSNVNYNSEYFDIQIKNYCK